MKVLYSVYPPTKWSIQLFKGENCGQVSVDSWQLFGLDSDRNYFPQEIVDYIKNRKQNGPLLFNPYNNKKNYLTIRVWRDGKWNPVFNWPLSKFNPGAVIPHKDLLKDLWKDIQFKY